MKAPFFSSKMPPTERLEVIEAPATFNRATRRAAGVSGRAWAWDPRALGIPTDLPARYVRRHYGEGILTAPKTRRQRKARARILRAMRPSTAH